MYKFLTLIYIILVSTSSFSQSVKNKNSNEELYNLSKDMSLNVSGYITFTSFSDKSWYQDSQTVAVNFDLIHDEYALRTQLVAGDDNKINRFTIEKNISIKDNNELLVKVGRFPRLISFYNNISDSPANYDIAMIPLGVYNRRLIRSQSFNAIDGVGLLYTYSNPSLNNNFLKVYLNYGQTPIDNQCTVQQEYRYDKCIPGYEFKSDIYDYDIGISYEYKDITLIASNTNIQFRTNLINSLDPVSNYLVKRTNRLIANVTKLGIKYEKERYLLQGEYSFHNYSTTTNLGITSSIHKENTFYVLGKYKWLNNLSANIQYSYANSAYLGVYIDRSIGVSYVYNDITFSLEQHRGSGIEWKKYFAEEPNWYSSVLTVSYTF